MSDLLRDEGCDCVSKELAVVDSSADQHGEQEGGQRQDQADDAKDSRGSELPWARTLHPTVPSTKSHPGAAEKAQADHDAEQAQHSDSGVHGLTGSYRSATAPEPSSSRLTSFKSISFDSPANNVRPWPANLGCTTNSYSSINPSSANASGSVTPPVNSPLPGSCLSRCTVFPRSPRTSSAFQSTRSSVLETTYFFAASIVRAKGSIQSGHAPVRAGGRNAASIIS